MKGWKRLRLILCCFIVAIFFTNAATAQKKLLILGSSTSAGFGLTNLDSSYIARLKSYFNAYSQSLIIDNKAMSGFNQYKAMPTGYIPPAGRSKPDTLRNITAGLGSFTGVDVVLVNFPSNGYDTFSVEEIMFCLRTIKQVANNYGKPCFITTTQPRQEGNSYKTAKVKLKMAAIKDSIMNEFGRFAINFYDGIVNPADSGILAKYNSGDGIHLNAAGHQVLFERVLESNIFAFTNTLASNNFLVRAQYQNGTANLQWQLSGLNNLNEFEIERSANGWDFHSIGRVIALSDRSLYTYTFIDPRPEAGQNYYRVVAKAKNMSDKYSAVVIVKAGENTTVSVYPNPMLQSNFTIKFKTPKPSKYQIQLVDQQGRLVHRETFLATSGVQLIPIQLRETIRKGGYTLTIKNEQSIVGEFTMIK